MLNIFTSNITVGKDINDIVIIIKTAPFQMKKLIALYHKFITSELPQK
jgi:hypothetical protein